MTPVVLVTGSSRGLGRAIAQAYAKHGYDVAINFNSAKTDAESLAAEINKLGRKSILLKADVSSSEQVNAMFSSLKSQWGRLDVLVNNAGNTRNRTIAKMSDPEWRDVMAVNLDGAFFSIRAALPLMRAQGGGAIINIVSYLAARSTRGAANYAAAKAGLISLTKSAAVEEGPHNIRVNAIMPGFHVTDMNKDVWARIEPDIRAQHTLPNMPDRTEMAEFVVKISELKSVSGQLYSFESRLL